MTTRTLPDTLLHDQVKSNVLRELHCPGYFTRTLSAPFSSANSKFNQDQDIDRRTQCPDTVNNCPADTPPPFIRGCPPGVSGKNCPPGNVTKSYIQCPGVPRPGKGADGSAFRVCAVTLGPDGSVKP
jgi:hypothetical protein